MATPPEADRRGERRPSIFPLVLTALVVASGMAYTLWWGPLVRHHPYWVVPQDFWATFRDAHFVGWGFIYAVYGAGTALVTLPGYPALMAPIAMLSSALGLAESSPRVAIPTPDAWLLAGPIVMLSAGVALFGLDVLARRLGGYDGNRRRSLALAAAGFLWPALALWGHPEDVVALGLVAFSLAAAKDGSWRKAGWLLGAAISMQLLAVLVVPVLLGWAGRGKLVPLLLRAALLPGFFLGAVTPDFRDAWRALTRQPNYPAIDHPTPWVHLSPSLGPHVVSAGPARMIGLVVAGCAGLVAIKWRRDPRRLIWLVAVAMAARCGFEAVMVPYYVLPAVTLALVAGCANGRFRWSLTLTAGTAATIVTHLHAGPWVYWLEMMGPLVAMLAASWPAPKTNAEMAPGGQSGHEMRAGVNESRITTTPKNIPFSPPAAPDKGAPIPASVGRSGEADDR